MGKQYNRKDSWYHKAQDEGLRSRAAFKIKEINSKYRLFKKGDHVLDLGAWPGSWLQIVSEIVGEQGLAVGIDLVEIERVGGPSVDTFVGDVRDRTVIERALALSGRPFDCVVSDMAPKLTGIRERDNALVQECVEAAYQAAQMALRPGGHFVVKMFRSAELDAYAKTLQKSFKTNARSVLESTRSSSNEVFFIGCNFQKGQVSTSTTETTLQW